jgi:hypothetical protein
VKRCRWSGARRVPTAVDHTGVSHVAAKSAHTVLIGEGSSTAANDAGCPTVANQWPRRVAASTSTSDCGVSRSCRQDERTGNEHGWRQLCRESAASANRLAAAYDTANAAPFAPCAERRARRTAVGSATWDRGTSGRGAGTRAAALGPAPGGRRTSSTEALTKPMPIQNAAAPDGEA